MQDKTLKQVECNGIEPFNLFIILFNLTKCDHQG